MKVEEIEVKDYLTKSNLPASDFTINPYVGCPHGCKYCYASFMRRFTGHTENWGEFIDIKRCNKKIDLKKIEGKTLFLSSVTDCYNEFEKEYGITKSILEQLVNANVVVNISTKSSLILRDVELLKKLKHLTVSISINTLDENFKNDMDHASSIQDRMKTLKTLHENGIYVILFMSPIFPYITDFESIISCTKEFVDEYFFENLNLRGGYKRYILNYIHQNYPHVYQEYLNIYEKKDDSYWKKLSKEIEEYCSKNNIRYKNYFYHEKLVSTKNSNKGESI